MAVVRCGAHGFFHSCVQNQNCYVLDFLRKLDLRSGRCEYEPLAHLGLTSTLLFYGHEQPVICYGHPQPSLT